MFNADAALNSVAAKREIFMVIKDSEDDQQDDLIQHQHS